MAHAGIHGVRGLFKSVASRRGIIIAASASAVNASRKPESAVEHNDGIRAYRTKHNVICEPVNASCGWRLALERLPSLVSLPQSSSSKEMHGLFDEGGVEQKLRRIIDAVLPIAHLFEVFFARVSPESLPKALVGMNILAFQDKNANSQYAFSIPSASEASIMEAGSKYMRLASAAYGPLLLNPLMFPDKSMLKSLTEDPLETVSSHCALGKAFIRILHASPNSSWLNPAHYVVHDLKNQEVVVTVRGTLSVEDVITDLGANEVDLFVGGKAHAHILQSACNVLQSIAPHLEGLAGQVKTITFTGHSLGGGVAAYLTLLFNEIIEIEQGSNTKPTVQCFTFGAPCVCSLDTSRKLHDKVIAFCHADDIVPRLSFGHVVELHQRAIAAADAAGGGLVSIREDVQKANVASLIHRMASIPNALRTNYKHLSDSHVPVDTEGKLYPAGRCFIVKRNGMVAELDPEELAPYISLAGGKNLLFDHFPPAYEKALDSASSLAGTPLARL